MALDHGRQLSQLLDQSQLRYLCVLPVLSVTGLASYTYTSLWVEPCSPVTPRLSLQAVAHLFDPTWLGNDSS